MSIIKSLGFSVLIALLALCAIDIGGKLPIQLGTPGMLEAYGIPGLPTDASVSGGLNTQAIGGYLNLGRRSSTPQFQNPKSMPCCWLVWA